RDRCRGSGEPLAGGLVHSAVFDGITTTRPIGRVFVRDYLSSAIAQMRSNTAAIPWPPPMHIVTTAYLPPVRCSSESALTVSRAPAAAIGGPRHTCPPLRV